MGRGVSQLDWIMSLAIFLLYIGWFFVYVTPQITTGSNEDALMVLLMNNFKDEFSLKVLKYPLFISTNNTGTVPIIMEYTSNESVSFTDSRPVLQWNNKLIFLTNTSQDTLWLINQPSNFTRVYKGMEITSSWTSIDNMTTRLSRSLPHSIDYIDRTRIDDLSISINDISFGPESYGYSDKGLGAFYSAATENINHTTFILVNLPHVHNYLFFDNDQTYEIALTMDLDTYDHYYSDNNDHGSFQYGSEAKHVSYNTSYITLYGEDALSIYFSSPAYLNFTSYNDSLSLAMKSDANEEFSYTFKFHQGDYTDAAQNEQVTTIGATYRSEGIYMPNITTNYTYFKDKWKFPSQRHFIISVYPNSSAYTHLYNSRYVIGSPLRPKNNVLAVTQDMYAIDTKGQKTPIHINYKLW